MLCGKIGNKNITGHLVIPSGIRCAHTSAIERYFAVDTVGIITTKSISFEPMVGYIEPLYAKYADNSYINAVGLENPGAAIFKDELSRIVIPADKFLLVSIFGKDAEDFLKTAKTLIAYADGFELNMSCPHAKGYGLQIGNDLALVAEITKKVSGAFDVPVFVKLSASIPNVAEVARTAIANGAAGITAINSVGPGLSYVAGKPILSNVVGGLSGEAIRPLGLKVVRDIRAAIGPDPLIIGMGGVFNKDVADDYIRSGANFVGVGSALTGLNTVAATEYLNSFKYNRTITPKPVDNMQYHECKIEENTALTNVLHKLKISDWQIPNEDTAGKFFFLMIPETGEKPFALFSRNTREFIIKNVGRFTNVLTKLQKGDTLFIRGPYGNPLPQYSGKTINFAAGGTGISPVFEIAQSYAPNNKIRFFFGGRTANDIFDLDRFKKLGQVIIATDDGSAGVCGFVSDILKDFNFDEPDNNIFINVGPKVMIESCYAIQKNIVHEDNIWASIEYHTSCGVGICGKCATETGFISCVDGPFFKINDVLRIPDCTHM